MTREQANDLLNAVAAGADVPLEKINEALVLTGDAKTMTKTKIETACEGVQAVGTPATVTQVAEALGVAGVWEVQQALETGPSNASRYVSIALSRRWIAPASDGGIRKYAISQPWRDHVAGAQESVITPAVAPENLKVERVGNPRITGPLAGTIWRACFAVAA